LSAGLAAATSEGAVRRLGHDVVSRVVNNSLNAGQMGALAAKHPTMQLPMPPLPIQVSSSLTIVPRPSAAGICVLFEGAPADDGPVHALTKVPVQDMLTDGGKALPEALVTCMYNAKETAESYLSAVPTAQVVIFFEYVLWPICLVFHRMIICFGICGDYR
jgi:hypothetical protein